jgi:thiamine pyrophosphate-dependent acetolactate synthase large subunit-like protein
VHVEGRKQPVGYQCVRSDGRDLWVVGHYETQCGGADTINKIDDIYAQVRHAAGLGYDVIYEGGALVQSDWRRAADVAKNHEMTVVVLDVPIELCLDAIRERRARRGDTKPFDPKNTISRARDTLRNAAHLETVGVRVVRFGNRESAALSCLEALGWS